MRELLPKTSDTPIRDSFRRAEEPIAEIETMASPDGDCLAGGGKMGALMRSMDWSNTPIGPVESWSPALRMMVRVLLANRLQMLIWWGPEFCQLYNDAFWPALGVKHPRSMGQRASECWPEIWHIIGPLIETPFRGGEASWMDDIFLEMNRRGFTEETHWTIAYSPIPDHSQPSRIGGVLGTVNEITEKVVGERRVQVLRNLGTRAAEAKSAQEACAVAARTLGQHREDVPFALFYLISEDRNHARLAAVNGVEAGRAESRVEIDPGEGMSREQPWPLAEAIRSETMQIVEDLEEKLSSVPPGPWSDPPRLAVVLPIRSNIAHQLAGLLILGISSRLKFDESYRDFCELVTSQVATAIANARAYEEERKRAEALAEIDRAKTAFFSNVSHEFRTPLTLILAPIEEMLARASGSLTVNREELDLIHRNTQRLLKLVNTLLDFSRIEAGRAQAAYERIDLPVFTADLASTFRSAIEKAGLRLIVNCPPLSESVLVDRGMWEKIVLNLLSNAFKFTFEGEVTVTLQKAGERVELSVSDTGTGVPEHELPHLFERFHRIESARGRTFEGSGIGLALVQELAKLHGGTVRAESIYGKGSRFIVSIPLGCAHLPGGQITTGARLSAPSAGAGAFVQEAIGWLPDASVASAGSSQALHASMHRTSGRILLADDNADLRHYVKRLLSQEYEVQTVTDGEAALAAARENPPDLVLTDVMMPRLDGFGLIAALRADPRTQHVPLILLSARAGEESRVEGLSAGANDYLVKPFSARELLARVSASLKTARDNREELEREHELRTSAEKVATLTRDELVAELTAMNRLHQLSTRLLRETELQPLLEEVLNATVALQDADFGNVQLYNPQTRLLELVAQRGFAPHVISRFKTAYEQSVTSCGRALQAGQRVIIEDVLTDPDYAPFREAAAAAGYRALQTTPLFSRDGELLGMISTHFRRPHRPLERELRLTDLYARQAAELIERKQAEEALRRSEEKYRALFDSIDEGFCTIEVLFDANDKPIDYRFLEVNPSFEKQTGIQNAQGRRMREIAPLHEEHWFEIFGKIALTGESARFENPAAQLHRWFEVYAFRVGDPLERKVAVLFNDITERNRSEEALYKAQAELAHVTRITTMGELAASIAHEINQPLGAIVNNSSACIRLFSQPGSKDEIRAALKDIASDASRASTIIARIRALIKRSAPEKTSLQLSEVIEEVLVLAHRELTERGIEVRTELLKTLPSVLADRVQLQQVFLNLIINGLEAMSTVEENRRILTIRGQRDQLHGKPAVRISVEDLGCGIAPEDTARIFESFYTTKPHGMGMGLRIGVSILEALGGRLWATPNAGPGVTFSCVVPAEVATTSELRSNSSSL
jgi:PAS domain S-box-containing protein